MLTLGYDSNLPLCSQGAWQKLRTENVHTKAESNCTVFPGLSKLLLYFFSSCCVYHNIKGHWDIASPNKSGILLVRNVEDGYGCPKLVAKLFWMLMIFKIKKSKEHTSLCFFCLEYIPLHKGCQDHWFGEGLHEA